MDYIESNIDKGRILQRSEELRLIVFTDSDYTNNEHRKDIMGGIMTIEGSPTYFKSKIQSAVN